jgi:hypothetical protein
MKNSNVSFGSNENSIINDEESRKQFENSVASLGDIYRLRQREIEGRNNKSLNLSKTGRSPDRKGRNYLNEINEMNPYRTNINNKNKSITSSNLNMSYSNNNISNFIQNIPNSQIEISYLTPAIIKESKKFSHVKNGKINPPKYNFSLKPETDKKIKNHEEEIKSFTLYASRVEIENEYNNSNNKRFEKKFKAGEGIQNFTGFICEDNYENYQNTNEENHINKNGDFEKNKTIVIGRGEIYKNNNRNLKKNIKSNNTKITINDNSTNEFYRGCERPSSKETRKILEKTEKFYSNTKDLFISNDQKVPSRCKIEEIINNVEDLTNSLENYKKRQNTNSLEKSKSKNKSDTNYLLKDSITVANNHKKFKITERTYKPIYIDPEERKKVEEKLEMLHIEIRATMDNIDGVTNKDEKLNDLINRSQNLSEILKQFSKRLKSFSDVGNSKNPDELVIKYQPVVKKNEVDEVIEILKTEGKEEIVKSGVIRHKSKEDNSDGSQKNKNTLTSDNYSSNHKKSSYNLAKSPSDGINISEDINKISPNTFMNYDFNKTLKFSTNSKFDQVNLGNSKISLSMGINDQNVYPDSQPPNQIHLIKRNEINSPNDTNKINDTNTMTNLANQSQTQIRLNSNGGNGNIINDNNTYHPYITNNAWNEFSDSLYKNSCNINEIKNETQNNFKSKLRDNKTINNQVGFQNNNELFSNSNTTSNNNQTSSLKMTCVPMGNAPNLKIDKENIKYDNRLTSYNIEFPVDYYHKMTKDNQPPTEKNWYVRQHHTETFAKNENAIPDDLLNTKYISYYGENHKSGEKNMEENIKEVIDSLENKIDSLKYELFKKSNRDSQFRKTLEKMSKLKEGVEEDYKSGKYSKNKSQYMKTNMFHNKEENFNINEILSDSEKSRQINYYGMFYKNEEIARKNVLINSYDTLLEDLRNKEKEILVMKRTEEYENIRPPVDRWWEIRNHKFREEMHRNRAVLNSPNEYFIHLDELKKEDLY